MIERADTGNDLARLRTKTAVLRSNVARLELQAKVRDRITASRSVRPDTSPRVIEVTMVAPQRSETLVAIDAMLVDCGLSSVAIAAHRAACSR